MKIKNIVLVSLLAFASLQLSADTLQVLGYTGDQNNPTAVFKWAKSDPEKAYYALQSGVRFNPTQKSQLQEQANEYTPGAAPAATPRPTLITTGTPPGFPPTPTPGTPDSFSPRPDDKTAAEEAHRQAVNLWLANGGPISFTDPAANVLLEIAQKVRSASTLSGQKYAEALATYLTAPAGLTVGSTTLNHHSKTLGKLGKDTTKKYKKTTKKHAKRA